MIRYEVYNTNFGAFKGEYNFFEDALARARETGFESAIYEVDFLENRAIIATWSPIGGLRKFYPGESDDQV